MPPSHSAATNSKSDTQKEVARDSSRNIHFYDQFHHLVVSLLQKRQFHLVQYLFTNAIPPAALRDRLLWASCTYQGGLTAALLALQLERLDNMASSTSSPQPLPVSDHSVAATADVKPKATKKTKKTSTTKNTTATNSTAKEQVHGLTLHGLHMLLTATLHALKQQELLEEKLVIARANRADPLSMAHLTRGGSSTTLQKLSKRKHSSDLLIIRSLNSFVAKVEQAIRQADTQTNNNDTNTTHITSDDLTLMYPILLETLHDYTYINPLVYLAPDEGERAVAIIDGAANVICGFFDSIRSTASAVHGDQEKEAEALLGADEPLLSTLDGQVLLGKGLALQEREETVKDATAYLDQIIPLSTRVLSLVGNDTTTTNNETSTAVPKLENETDSQEGNKVGNKDTESREALIELFNQRVDHESSSPTKHSAPATRTVVAAAGAGKGEAAPPQPRKRGREALLEPTPPPLPILPTSTMTRSSSSDKASKEARKNPSTTTTTTVAAMDKNGNATTARTSESSIEPFTSDDESGEEENGGKRVGDILQAQEQKRNRPALVNALAARSSKTPTSDNTPATPNDHRNSNITGKHPTPPAPSSSNSLSYSETLARAISAFDAVAGPPVQVVGGMNYLRPSLPTNTATAAREGGKRSRVRVEWSPAEDKALLEGVAKHGQSALSFRRIFSEYMNVWSQGRTPLKLSDHWRAALKARALSKMEIKDDES